MSARPTVLLLLLAAIAAGQAIASSAPPATPTPAEWKSYDLLLDFRALPRTYSCDELWYKVRDVLLQLGARAHEVFAVLFLDAQSRLITLEGMFRGTLTQTSVYPREVVKRGLDLHAAAVILAHNHPSGTAEPSRADEFLTQTLKSALALVDVRVLDHLVVGRGSVVSFAERGLL